MASIEAIRSEFLTDLWLPLLIEGGKQFYPNQRKNKKMKMFVFTDEEVYGEVSEIISSRITCEEKVYAWTDTLIKASRLQTLRPIAVLGSSRFEDTVIENIESLLECMPFDIVIFDFSRQVLQQEPDRLEKEIGCIEHVLRAQRTVIINEGFVFLYTTFLDNQTLSCGKIKQSSDRVHVDEWSGLSVTALPTNANLDEEKMTAIRGIISQLLLKHKCKGNLSDKISANWDGKKLYSICGIILRRV